MSPVKIYEIHRATNGQCKVFNDGDVSLGVSGVEHATAMSRSLSLRARSLAIDPNKIANITDIIDE